MTGFANIYLVNENIFCEVVEVQARFLLYWNVTAQWGSVNYFSHSIFFFSKFLTKKEERKIGHSKVKSLSWLIYYKQNEGELENERNAI